MIKKILVLLLMVAALPSFGQDKPTTPVQIQKSNQKVKIGGKFYFVHIVQKGETLFSISKAYGVSQADIAAENPDIFQGLKVDQALKIPASIIRESDLRGVTEDDDFIYHIVKKGETLSAISRLYQVPIEVLMKNNVEVENGLQESQVVVIPKSALPKVERMKDSLKKVIGTLPSDTSDIVAGEFLYHKVKAKETFYSLSKRYTIPLDTLIALNPTTDGILKLDFSLRVPLRFIHEAPTSTSIVIKDTTGEEFASPCNCEIGTNAMKKDTVHLALILPFNARKVDIVDSMSSGNPEVKVESEQQNFMNFYQGALMALEVLKDTGYKMDLQVLDSKRDPLRVREQVKRLSQSTELIIGPVYSNEIKPVAEYAQKRQIYMVSPLSPISSMVAKNPYLIQIRPTYIDQINALADYVSNRKDGNVVLLYEAGKDSSDLVKLLREKLSARFTDRNLGDSIIKTFHLMAYHTGQPFESVVDTFSKMFSISMKNLVVVPSDNEAFVSDLLSKLNNMKIVYNTPIELYGMPSWQRFESVDINNYYALGLRYISPYFVDYSSPLVKKFVKLYRNQFDAEPNQFAFQGFDVVYYFVPTLAKYGKSFEQCLPCYHEELIQSAYQFRRISPEGGFENSGVFKVRYTPEYEIINE
ncbi:MAG TPA: LysM peptidoglycan-binding domain-containing protein [Williamwhitmania sp.]|nr:LysM peptidoglycan-binding domain-containing protein [Williamwhitmania sp.]